MIHDEKKIVDLVGEYDEFVIGSAAIEASADPDEVLLGNFPWDALEED